MGIREIYIEFLKEIGYTQLNFIESDLVKKEGSIYFEDSDDTLVHCDENDVWSYLIKGSTKWNFYNINDGPFKKYLKLHKRSETINKILNS